MLKKGIKFCGIIIYTNFKKDKDTGRDYIDYFIFSGFNRRGNECSSIQINKDKFNYVKPLMELLQSTYIAEGSKHIIIPPRSIDMQIYLYLREKYNAKLSPKVDASNFFRERVTSYLDGHHLHPHSRMVYYSDFIYDYPNKPINLIMGYQSEIVLPFEADFNKLFLKFIINNYKYNKVLEVIYAEYNVIYKITNTPKSYNISQEQ